MMFNWIFGDKSAAALDPTAISNGKIAGLLDRCATYEKRALNAEAAHARVQRNNQTLGRALHEKVAECDELRGDAEKYRRARSNLKQFQPKANGAADQAVVS